MLKEVSPGCYWKDWCWSWNSNTLATWWDELTHLKRPWCWERLRAGGEGDNRGWDVWMASLTQWTGVWVDSGCWWWTGSPGVLWFMESDKESDTTKWLNRTELRLNFPGEDNVPILLGVKFCKEILGQNRACILFNTLIYIILPNVKDRN